MDPNPWSRFNPAAYSHIGHSGSLNQSNTRFDLPLLAAEQVGLNTGLSLGAGLPPSHVPGRHLSSLQVQGSSVPIISSGMPPLLDSVNQPSLSTHNPYKALSGQSGLSSEVGLIRSDAGSLYGSTASIMSSDLSRSKHFGQEQVKDSYNLNQGAVLDRSKGWGLSNFMPISSANAFGNTIGEMDNVPPPAHSGSNKSNSMQKSPFSTEDLIHQQSKYCSMSMPLFNPGVQPKSESNVTSPTSSLLASYGIGSQDNLKTQSPFQQAPSVGNINYDPVSPVSDSGHQNDQFNDLNLHEFAQIAHQKAQLESRQQMLMQGKGIMQEISQSRNSMTMNPGSVRHSCNSPQIQSSQSLHSTHSPLQQPSPHSNHGNSPHIPVESPQHHISSSSLVTTPPTIQAVPDSTTKPKKPRVRKKKLPSITREPGLEDKLKQYQNSNMSNQHDNANLLHGGNTNQSPMMNIQNYSSHTNYPPYSPQKRTSSSPQTPQSYSPHLSQQSIVEGNFSPNIQRNVPNSPLMPNQNSPLVSEQFHMQRTAVGNHPVSSQGNVVVCSNSGSIQMGNMNQVPVISEDNNTARPRHIHHVQNTSGIVENSHFTFTQQNRSFVEQLTGSNEIEMEKVGMEDPLGMQALGLTEGEGYSVPPQQTAVYSEVHNYENHYSYGGSPLVQRQTSTIDEDALSNLIGQSNNQNQVIQTVNKESSPEAWTQSHVKNTEDVTAVAITTQPEFDEEFAHLSKPPPVKTNGVSLNRQDIMVNPLASPVSNSKPLENMPSLKIEKKNPNSGFMDSFLSFIQGKKPETLSSVNSSVVKRPELPKYIPEPPRKRLVEQVETKTSSDSAASTPKPEFIRSPSSSQNDSIAFSDDDDFNNSNSNITSSVQNVITSLNEDGKPSLKLKISLNKNSRSAFLKSETKVKSKKHSRSTGSGKGKKKKARNFASEEEAYIVSSGDEDEYQVDSADPDEESKHIDAAPPSPKPVRRTSNRRAKEAAKGKKSYVLDSDSDDIQEIVPLKSLPREEGDTYDSDQDPEWAPSADKRVPGFDNEKKPKTRLPRMKPGRKRGSSSRKSLESRSDDISPAPKLKKLVHKSSSIKYHAPPGKDEEIVLDKPETEKPKYANILLSPYESNPGYRIGEFVMDNKDLAKFETFPIWKIEPGRMIRKYELVTENGLIRHKSLCTFSSWIPKMEKDFTPIRVRPITSNRDGETVEVFEEDKPKPKLDSSLANAYEEDPLADLFNIYLQIFLSQALEPGFLSAILDSEEEFYLGPLNSIDKIISRKLVEIDQKVQWKDHFTRSLKAKPHIREVDRPNLRTSCQACERSNQPAVKSVHLFGQSYDPVTLEELPSSSIDGGSVEFLIGQTASNYVSQYHNLYHFKYNLSKRCFAKVDIVRQGYKELENAEILDKCLNNRTWVLKIFDDLKIMLDKG